MIIFIKVPTPDITVRLFFEEESLHGQQYDLYYAENVQNDFREGSMIHGDVDPDSRIVSFRLSGDHESSLSGIRLDLPPDNTEELVVREVSVSSGGITRKFFSGREFFSPERIIVTNDLICTPIISGTASIMPTGPDPYIAFSPDVVSEIRAMYSHFLLTRIALIAFIALSYLIASKDPFHSSTL